MGTVKGRSKLWVRLVKREDRAREEGDGREERTKAW